jgi:hypothetical protein
MKSPNLKEWEEMPDGSLRYLSTNTHTEVDVLIFPVEERKPLTSSRVRLAWRNRETGATVYWLDKRAAYLKPREIALSTAIARARTHYRNTGMLLRIGITDEHEYTPFGVSRW